MITILSNPPALKPNKEELNFYKKAVLPIVSDAAHISSEKLTVEEKAARTDAWARLLIGIVPEERLPDCLDVAIRLHRSTYPLNGFAIKLAWEKIEAAEAEERADALENLKQSNPVLRCSHADVHATALGDVLMQNPYSENDELLPCAHCRPEDHKNWRKTQIALYGEHRPKTVLPSESPKARRPEEVRLPAAEIEALLVEHNTLVRQITEPEAWRNLELVFDEGGNVFKLPHRADVLYTVQMMRRKIADYQRIINARANA